MRRLAGWLVLVIGSLALLVGAAIAVAFGPDDTVRLGPHRLTSSGAAIATAPQVLSYAGLTLTVTATRPNAKAPIFIGVGHDVDVRDYLAGTTYTRIDSLSLPWRVQTSSVSGPRSRTANPEGLTWWLTTAADRGDISATFPLPDAPVDIVVMDPTADVAGEKLSVDVSVGVVVPGTFPGGLALLLAGGGLLVAGLAVRRAARVSGKRVAVRQRVTV